MAKVSVIVPVYNVEKYLDKCITSLINQTLSEIQIIIVNDGSTDSSGEIAKKYAEKNPNKIIYLEKENGGLSDARNFGLPYATGEYIAFLDSDDYIDIDAYEKMYNRAIEEDSDFVECDFIWEYPDKKREDIKLKYENKKDMFVKIRVVAWNKLIRAETIKKMNLTFPKGLRYEDIEFTYKLLTGIRKYSYVGNTFVHYMQRNDSIANNQNERTKEIFTIIDNVVQYYKDNDIYKEYENELEYTFTRILLCSSLKRITKVKEKEKRKELERQNWIYLNKKFPNWKKNKYLKEIKNAKNMYMQTVNQLTYSIYVRILEVL